MTASNKDESHLVQPLKYSQFGSADGQLVVYFHGAPGAPEEAAVFDVPGKQRGLTIICFDRFAADTEMDEEAYYRLLAKEILAKSDGKPVDMIGFSIGVFVALQTSRYMADGVASLHLVSAAAPLEAGDFLDAMAGKQVFRLAKQHPLPFILLSHWQGLLARFFPDALYRLLFASAMGADKALAAEPGFRSGITRVLRSCFSGRVRGYARDVRDYVRPWQATLSGVNVPTHLWHGAEDNWSPCSMAEYLKTAIPGCTSIRIFGGLSHYSCLYAAAPEICEQIGKA